MGGSDVGGIEPLTAMRCGMAGKWPNGRTLGRSAAASRRHVGCEVEKANGCKKSLPGGRVDQPGAARVG